MKTTSTKPINPIRHSLRRDGSLLIPLACAMLALALSPPARATCQQGCDLGGQNTFLGDDAFFGGSGNGNTAIGYEALYNNSLGGSLNTAVGEAALFSNTSGYNNTALGVALGGNTGGHDNTATGLTSLNFNTTGSYNTADGVCSLQTNTTGIYNTATGYFALYASKTANNNTADGAFALAYSTGQDNTATGYGALFYTTTGSNNTAAGFQALEFNNTGKNNTAVGNNALSNNLSGSNNIAIGASAGGGLTTGSNNIDIGAFGAAGESNTIRIGSVTAPATATYIQGISGVASVGGVAVFVNSNGRLGTVLSSARFKDNIQPMAKSSEAVLSLKPVTFRYKKELDPKAIPQFGLVAEDVAKVDPDLVARDNEGKPYTVRYEAVNAMLLNEFLKEHKKVEEQTKTVEQQANKVEAQTKKLAAQASKIEQLETRLEQMAARLDAKGL